MYQWLQRLFSLPPEPGRRAAPDASPRTDEAQPGQAAPPLPDVVAEPPPQSGVSFEQKDKVNTDYYGWLFGTHNISGLDINAPESQVLDALDAIAKSKQSGAELVRRLPGLIPQVLQSLRSDHFSGAEIARKISSDVVLVATVIRLANNAMQQGGTTINSVEHAVIVIGQEGLRQLITAVAFRPIIDLNSGRFTRTLAPQIWGQSERCAMASRALAEQQGIDPLEAFLAGLVQDVGLIVSLRVMDQVAKDNAQMGSALFCASLLRHARQLSCSIGQEWNFPPAVTHAIGEQLGMHKRMSPLGRLLSMTDYLSKIKILAENSRLDGQESDLLHGLPESALLCYRDLGARGDPSQAAP